jgi:glycosyltransferase involved in cell wall biosynthesis
MTKLGGAPVSVITATYNSAAVLPRLIASLAAQTDQHFEWVISDGGSTDGTLELLEQARHQFRSLIVDSRPDFGIYDALNRGVRRSSSDYYLVLGSDDELVPDAIETFKSLRDASGADFVSCRYHVGALLARARAPRWEFLYGLNAHVTGHSVGLLIRKSLHEKVGDYARTYPIAADQLFVLSAIRAGATVKLSDAIVGRFSIDGVSSSDTAGLVTEIFRINVRLGHNFFLQLALLFWRMLRRRALIERFQRR